MTELRLFLTGRPLHWLVPAVVLIYALAYMYWYVFVGDRCVVSVREMLPVGFCVIGSLLASPRFASWEALGAAKTRRMAAASVLCVLMAAAVFPVAHYLVITRLPDRLIPQSTIHTMEGYEIEVVLPLVSNIITLGGIVLVSVAVLGRRLGPLTLLVLYPVGLWLDGSTSLPSPYVALCLDASAREPKWLPALAFAGVGLGVWYRTGGATWTSRQLDGVGLTR